MVGNEELVDVVEVVTGSFVEMRQFALFFGLLERLFQTRPHRVRSDLRVAAELVHLRHPQTFQRRVFVLHHFLQQLPLLLPTPLVNLLFCQMSKLSQSFYFFFIPATLFLLEGFVEDVELLERLSLLLAALQFLLFVALLEGGFHG